MTAERISVQREEEGTQDGALRNPSSERTRIRHRSSTSYPVSAVVGRKRKGRVQCLRSSGPEEKR